MMSKMDQEVTRFCPVRRTIKYWLFEGQRDTMRVVHFQEILWERVWRMAMRTRQIATAVVLALSAAVADAAPKPAIAGPNSPLPFPASSHLVVQINGLERSRERLEKMISEAMPDQAAQLKKSIQEGLDHLLAGRKLSVIPPDGPCYIVLHRLSDVAENAGDGPLVAILLPVTSAKDFRESFLTPAEWETLKKGEGGIEEFKIATSKEITYLVELPGYVALTPDESIAQLFSGKYEKGTPDRLGREVIEAMLSADVSVYLNITAIKEEYGNQIRAFRQLMDFAFQQGAGAAGISQSQMEAIKLFSQGLFQGIEDAQALVLGLEFRPPGLGVQILGRFADNTATSRLLRDEQTKALEGLGRLPTGHMAYVGGKLSPALADALKGLMAEVQAAEDDDATAKAISEYLDALKAAGPTGAYSATSLPANSLQVEIYQDPAKAVAAELKLFKSLTTGSLMQSVQLKEKPKVRENAHRYEGFTFNEIQIAFDFEATVKNLPEEVREATMASMKKMMNETITIFHGTDGKEVLTVMAKNWDSAKAQIADYLSGKATLAQQPGYQLTRRNLPVRATAMAVIELSQASSMIADYMQTLADQIPGLPAEIPALKIPKTEPIYIGASLALKPAVIQADLFIPGTAARLVQKVLAPLLQNID